MAKRFVGKKAWITGGGSGIGRALAMELAKEGADVAVSGRRKDRLEEVARDLEACGVQALALTCDVTDEASVKSTVADVVAAFGQLDVVVANAGFAVGGAIESLSAADWRRQFETNVVGLACTAKESLPFLRQSDGRLVLIGSAAAFIPAPRSGAYAASKYAVRAIGQTLAIELHGAGATCTTIHPGYVASEIAMVDNAGRFRPERKDRRPKKLIWDADRAARVMVDAIYARRREVVFTGHGRFAAFVGKHTPGLVHLAFTRRRGTTSSAAPKA